MNDREPLQQRLLVTFAAELGDAVRLLDEGLVRLEQEMAATGGDDLVRELFRVAHGVKGAAHSAGVGEAVGAASRLEEALATVRDRGAIPPDGTAVMLADVDELARVHAGLTGIEDGDALPAAPPAVVALADGRVAVHKLDSLVYRSGDLVTVAGRIDDLAADLRVLADSRQATRRATLETTVRSIADAARELTRLTTDIGDATRALTFEPFDSACVGLARVVHDISTSSGKEADLRVVGGDVEIDRAIAASLREPLLHLVRNAVHHGIETVAERRRARKPQRGEVTITAALRAGGIEVRVTDDGNGMDAGALERAARERGIVDVSDPAGLAFIPGVSTSGAVTDVSGRGVGLDAVRGRLESLGGGARLTSRPGEGTTVTLVCPITLALLPVLVVATGEDRLCIPLPSVARVVRARSDQLRQVEGRTVLVSDDRTVPIVPLAIAAGLAAQWKQATDDVRVVIVDIDGRPLGLAVDELREAAQVVVKALPTRLTALDTLLGAAALPDGGIALIVNTAVCAQRALTAPRGVLDHAAPEPAPRVPRVVLAEDNLTTRTLERTFLEAAGYEVLAAADGAEAWQLLDRHGADIVVTDVDMPRTDGIELCRRIRASDRFARLPVILVTSLGSDDDRRRGLEAGADVYMVKAELQQESLLDIVGRLV